MAAAVLERTCALIKPDALDNASEILQLAELSGLTIIDRAELRLSRQQAAALYAGHSGQPYFASLLAHIRSGPVLALALAGRDAVTKWREAIGPTDPAQARATAPRSLRALYGGSVLRNALHGSWTPAAAAAELRLFFPHLAPPLSLGDAGESGSAAAAAAFVEKHLHRALVSGLTAMAKSKEGSDPVTLLSSLGGWLLANNANKPRQLAPFGGNGFASATASQQPVHEVDADALIEEAERRIAQRKAGAVAAQPQQQAPALQPNGQSPRPEAAAEAGVPVTDEALAALREAITAASNDADKQMSSAGRLIAVLEHHDPDDVLRALAAVGAVVSAGGAAVEVTIKAGLLPALSLLVGPWHKKPIRLAATSLVADLAAGSPATVGAVIESGLAGRLLELIKTGDGDIKKEAARGVASAAAGATEEQVTALADAGAVARLAYLLNMHDETLVLAALRGLTSFFQAGRAADDSSYADAFHHVAGDKLLNLIADRWQDCSPVFNAAAELGRLLSAD